MYSEQFYDAIAQGCISSARVVVNEIILLLQPLSVIDVGCGQGHWLAAFANYGCEILGIDGDYVNRDALAIPSDKFKPYDLEQEFSLDQTFDLAISLEVAEHLSESASDGFIRSLTKLAPVILFSAAIPGQQGNGHINLKWPSWWIEKFEANGFDVSGALRWKFWDDRRIENWYRQNMLLCVRKDIDYKKHFLYHEDVHEVMHGPLSHVWHVVHPERI